MPKSHGNYINKYIETVFMKLLETYRGASIYQERKLDPSQYQILNLKLIAKGRMPEPQNMLIHFDVEAPTREEALKKIKTDIDTYLSDHHLEKLISEH